MARYIDVDKLIKKSIRIEGHFDLPSGKAQNFSAIDVTEILNFPPADVAPVVHGKWVNLGGRGWRCSNCGFIIGTEGIWEPPNRTDQCNIYCRCCGAKMDNVLPL